MPLQNPQPLWEQLSLCLSEDEVRLAIADALEITNELRIVGSTDGLWNDRLFEFKFDKGFRSGTNWSRAAFGTLAQALYYCRRSMNLEIEGQETVPHTIVICDKNGGFLIPTRQFEGLLHFDPDVFSSRRTIRETLQTYFGEEWQRLLTENTFSWLSPPSSQQEGLVEILIERQALSGVRYYDFSNGAELQQFIANVESVSGSSPRIDITKYNFVQIFDIWLLRFATGQIRRREWADRFVIDARKRFILDPQTGRLSCGQDSWIVPVGLYQQFWDLYVRPPEEAVDQFIATNKDLLYDISDQNNYGDFYTPLKTVALAQKWIQHTVPDAERSAWWDPAAGGGNLFFRFTKPNKVILSTKFQNDCEGLINNPALQGATVLQLDFINEQIENSPEKWNQILSVLAAHDRLIFFMNPPFDDQAESGGTNESIPENFLEAEDRDLIPARALRSVHTRFFYQILRLAKRLNKEVIVASFSATAWIVGPDSRAFFRKWSRNFSFLDGFLISSKVFNGIDTEWPVLFSVWRFSGQECQNAAPPMILDTFDQEYRWIGRKTLLPFDEQNERMCEIARLTREQLGSRDAYVTVPPLKNECEITTSRIYDDTLPLGSLGYLRTVANDVYNSAMRVQILSSIFGSSNHNGVPILPINFEPALAVYGIRKSVKGTWLNNKDEFYVPENPSGDILNLYRKAVVFALIDGGYTSSIEGLSYEGQSHSFLNEFFICSNEELRESGLSPINPNGSYASRWILARSPEFTTIESRAIEAAGKLILATFEAGVRAQGDPTRQLWRVDAGMRQLINGLLDYEGYQSSPEMQDLYLVYRASREALKKHIESEVYRLGILQPFADGSDDEAQLSTEENEQLRLIEKELNYIKNKLTKRMKNKQRGERKKRLPRSVDGENS